MGIRGRNSQQQLVTFHPIYAGFFLAGLSCVYLFPGEQPVVWLSLPIIVGITWLHDQKGFSFAATAFLLGAVWISLIAQQRLDARWPEERHGEDVELTGHVTSISRQGHQLSRFLFESKDVPGLIRVAWYRGSQDLHLGQCWRFTLRMRSPRGNVNPGGFDYEGWLFREGIVASAYVRQASPCVSEPSIHDWRSAAIDTIGKALADHEMKAQIMALSFGYRDDFQQSDWDVLRRTGTSHLMAISGLHIGIVAGWAFWLAICSWRYLPKLPHIMAKTRWGLFCSLTVALIYTWASGMGLPAQRAMIMLGVLYLASWAGRRVSPMQLLSLALIGLLLVDPFSVGNAGFWLSFGAVFCILYLLSNRWRPMGRVHGLVWIQICLSLALLPLTLLWFREVSWVAPLVNLFLVPVFTLLVPGILVAVVWVLVDESTGYWLLELLADSLLIIWEGLKWIDSLEDISIMVSTVRLLSVGIAILGAILMCAPKGLPAKWVGGVFFIPLLLPPLVSDDSLRITVLDVGQGLSVIAESSGHVLLYDAGPAYKGGFDAGAMVVLPYLRHRGINEIDVLVQSHEDLDHSGGVPAVLSEMPVRHTYGIERGLPCRKGEQWYWGDVGFEFLHPDSAVWSGNNSSCVLKITMGDNRVLLTGDIEAPVERHLTNEQSKELNSDVLVVPHHGSASSSTQAFLNAVNPEIAIVSSGWKNRWGFPRADIVSRYREKGVKLYSTAELGAVILHIRKDAGVSVPSGWRAQSRRLWRNVNPEAYF